MVLLFPRLVTNKDNDVLAMEQTCDDGAKFPNGRIYVQAWAMEQAADSKRRFVFLKMSRHAGMAIPNNSKLTMNESHSLTLIERNRMNQSVRLLSKTNPTIPNLTLR
jgi:hypothetical protein